jgi:pimeloyl-ACP methyl ester carboxylesterase
VKDSTIQLADGRTLAYTDIGDSNGRCVFFFHGAPTTRLRLVDFEKDFEGQRLRVVSADRPGYGGSSPQAGRSMSDWPRDVAVLADELGIEQFVVAGHSSGGPYAVACCALLAGRVNGGVVFGGVTNMGWEGAWEGYLPTETTIMRLPDEAAAISWCEREFGEDGSGFSAAIAFDLPAPDAAMLEAEPEGTYRRQASTEAFRQGVVGYAQDIFVQGRPWLFDAASISVPVVVVHGEEDSLVPLAHSRHTADIIPTAELRVWPGHGHFTTLAVLPALVDELGGLSS